jgi:hypothetical protein
MSVVAYEEHVRCDTPADDTVIWRYMGFLRFMSLLETSGLWLSRADLLDDPREGRLTDLEVKQIREQQGGRADEFVRTLERQRHTTFVSCWHENISESMAMWDLYGKEPGSVALKSTVERMKNALAEEARPLYIGRIRYLDWTQASWPNNVLGMSVRKTQRYKHESEVRLVAWDPDWPWNFGGSGSPRPIHPPDIVNAIVAVLKGEPIFSHTFEADIRRAAPDALNKWEEELQLAQVPAGIAAKADLASLVDQVILGPKEPEWTLDLVRSIAERYKLTATVRSSDLRYSQDDEYHS